MCLCVFEEKESLGLNLVVRSLGLPFDLRILLDSSGVNNESKFLV